MKLKYITTKTIAAIELILVCCIFILFYLTREVTSKRVIYIPKGNSNYTIKKLQKSGVDIAIWDKPFLYFLGYLQAGWVDLKATHMTKLDFLYKLTHSKAAIVKVMIIPGESNYYIYKLIAKKLRFRNFRCNIDEGIIKPDTYYLPLGMSKRDVCKFLYNKSINWHKMIAKKFLGVWNYKQYYKKIIIASIIQKEAANTIEMPYISAVIYNRLKRKMKLQMDGALNYGRYAHKKVTPQRIKSDNSFYNTYKYYGLPKKAICVVSKEAIKAAFFPAKVNYLYFVKCGKKHLFATSYKAHLRNIRKCKK